MGWGERLRRSNHADEAVRLGGRAPIESASIPFEEIVPAGAPLLPRVEVVLPEVVVPGTVALVPQIVLARVGHGIRPPDTIGEMIAGRIPPCLLIVLGPTEDLDALTEAQMGEVGWSRGNWRSAFAEILPEIPTFADPRELAEWIKDSWV